MLPVILSALMLSLRMVLPGFWWTGGRSWRSVADRAGRTVVVGLLLNLLPALLLCAVGQWGIWQDWLSWGVVSVGSVWLNRASLADAGRAGGRLVACSALVAVVVVVPLLLPVRSEWVAGGWDPGVYQNNAVAIAHRHGWVDGADSVFVPLSTADRQMLVDDTQVPYYEVMPGVPVRLRDGALPLYFPPLTPVCGAWLLRLGGMPVLLRMPAVVAFLGLLPFLSFCGLLGLSRWQRLAAVAFLLLSPMWWYHQAVPTTEMLYLLLMYGGVVFYAQAMEAHDRVPVAAMLVLFAATLNHFNVPALAGVLLLAAAGAEVALDAPRRHWRLMCGFGALLAGLCWGVHFCWITLYRLQEKDAALSVLLSVLLAGAVLAGAVASLRPSLFQSSAGGWRRVRQGLQVLVAGLLLLTLFIAAGDHLGGWRIQWHSIPLAGVFLHAFSRLLAFHGVAWFILVLIGVWMLIRHPAPRPLSAVGLVILSLGLIFVLLLAIPGITPVYPWALRRYLVAAVPFMAVSQGCVAAWVMEARRASLLRRVLAAVLVVAAAAGGLRVCRHAARVGDYRGLPAVLADLDRHLEPGDTVIVDDARWGTPLMLLHGHDVLNGERLMATGGLAEAGEVMEALRRVQSLQRGRLIWLTSREVGLAVYPRVPDYVQVLAAPVVYDYSTVIHGAGERGFRTEPRRAVFRLYEQVDSPPPPLTAVGLGPYRLLGAFAGGATAQGLTLQWGGGDALSVHPQAGWQVVALPPPIPGAEAMLRWSWSPAHGRPPTFQLYGAGEPLDLICRRGQVEPAGSLAPVRAAAAGLETVFPLPFAPGVAAVQVSLSTQGASPSGRGAVGLRLGEVHHTLSLSARCPAASVLLAVTDIQHVQIDTAAIPVRQRLNLRLQPLYPVLDCEPVESGVHVFRTVGTDGAPAGNIARRLEGGGAYRVKSGGGGLVGACLYVHDGTTWHRSVLTDDALVRFEGFHARENTGDPRRPYQRWSASGESFIRITTPPEADVRIAIRLRDVRPPDVEYGRMELQVGGRVYPVVFSESVWSVTLNVPSGLPRGGEPEAVTVRFASDTWSPAAVMASGDDRTLGLLVDELSVYFPGASDGGGPR